MPLAQLRNYEPPTCIRRLCAGYVQAVQSPAILHSCAARPFCYFVMSQVIRKKRLEVTETIDGDNNQGIVDPANVGIILENEPVRLEGVVRADDPSEFQKPLELEKGWAKNLASRFQQQMEQSDGKPSFKLDVEIGAEPEV